MAAARARGTRPVAVVGRDPRASGEFLEAAVTAGLASAGLDVIRVGVIPTPGVAYLTQTLRADLGVTISASHNAMPDNGIKLFDRFGYKLSDEIEEQIEARIDEPWQRPTGGGVGRVYDDPAGRGPLHRPPGGLRPAPAGRPAGRRRLRPRVGQRGRARGLPPARCPGAHARRRAQRPQHQRRHRLHPPRAAAEDGRRPRRRPRHRPRR